MTQMACDVVGIGENSVDVVYRLPAPLAANVKMPISGGAVRPGGQVATTLCTCARLGLRSRYIGTFGSDDHAALIRTALESYGVDTGSALVRQAPNRYAVILVEEATGDRTVLWRRDAALTLRIGDIEPALITDARLLHVDDVDEEASIAAAEIARAAGVQVTTDIDHVSSHTGRLIDAATCAILAEPVASALTGEKDPERAVRALRQRHGTMVCVTLGGRGAMLLDGDRLHRVDPHAVEVVDTTGAGDVFRGALIDALLRGDAPEDMLRFANAAAAISCTRGGAIGGVPTRREIEDLMG